MTAEKGVEGKKIQEVKMITVKNADEKTGPLLASRSGPEIFCS